MVDADDADEVGRDLKIYKVFVMGIYHLIHSVIDQIGSQMTFGPH